MRTRYLLSGFLMIIFHVIGTVGFLSPGLHYLFIKLVPFHLLLMFGLLLLTGYDGSRRFLILLFSLCTLGYLVEVAGVNTGLIFGDYQYGRALGYKVWNTPLMIGVNWFLLVYSTGVMFYSLGIRNRWLISLAGALLITLLDLLIEPVAIRFDYWAWADVSVPLQNYLAWFIFSFFLFLIFASTPIRKTNPSAIVFIMVQFAFFLVLNIWA